MDDALIPSVFVSHSSKDMRKAKRLSDLLSRSLGDGKVWMDDRSLKPGDRWWKTILKEVHERDCLVLVGSIEAWDSVFCRGELTEAWVHGKQIIVFQSISPSIPDDVASEVHLVGDDRLTVDAFSDLIAGILRRDSPSGMAAAQSTLWKTRESKVESRHSLMYKFRVDSALEPTNALAHLCNTGILLRKGDQIEIRAEGEIMLDRNNEDSWVRPDGLFTRGSNLGKRSYLDHGYVTSGNPPDTPPNKNVGGMLFRWFGEDGIRNNAQCVGFEAGGIVDITAQGYLHLAVNDNKTAYPDNSGHYSVTVIHRRPRP